MIESQPQIAQLKNWCPLRLYWPPGAPQALPLVDWRYVRDLRFTEPFFEQSVNRCLIHPFNAFFSYHTALDVARELYGAQPGLAPTGFIFHLSRCGSTLISQLLAALPQNIVLSEAPPLDFILRTQWQRPDIPDTQRIAWLQWIVSALGQPRHQEKNLFIKFDCWHILDLPLIQRAFPGVPWIFVYRDPVEILVSHHKQPGRQMVPSLVEPQIFGLTMDAFLPVEAYRARVLAAICQAAIQHRDCGSGRFVNYRQLPGALWTWLPQFFGIECSASDRTQMQRVAGFDAKNPVFSFTDDTATKQQQATALLREQAAQWLLPLYQQLEELRLASTAPEV